MIEAGYECRCCEPSCGAQFKFIRPPFDLIIACVYCGVYQIFAVTDNQGTRSLEVGH